MYVGYDSDEPFAMTLFSLINNKAIFLHSGRSDKGNNENLYEYFNYLILVELSKTKKIIDFEGVNSPKNSFKAKIWWNYSSLLQFNLEEKIYVI